MANVQHIVYSLSFFVLVFYESSRFFKHAFINLCKTAGTHMSQFDMCVTTLLSINMTHLFHVLCAALLHKLSILHARIALGMGTRW